MKPEVLKIIDFIVCYASDNDIRLTTIRLIKFLYLADLFYARWNEGRTFTNLPWAFVYYGPYCSEAYDYVETATQKGIIDRRSFPSKYEASKDYTLYFCKDLKEGHIEMLERQLPDEIVSEMKHVIKKYGDETPTLLDFVYFDTEPMQNARKGQLLDFSTARKPSISKDIRIKKISKKDIEKIRSHLSLLNEKYKSAQSAIKRDNLETGRWHDKLFYESILSLNEDELPEGLTGTAEIID